MEAKQARPHSELIAQLLDSRIPKTERECEPAFPVSTSDPRSGHRDGFSTHQFPGLSIRDYFAARAMQGALSTSSAPYMSPDRLLADSVAETAYQVADAMIAARCKLAAAPTPAEPPEAVVRDAEPWKLLLENLVEGLNKTHWSSWQGTAHFDEYLQEAISAIERDKLKGQS